MFDDESSALAHSAANPVPSIQMRSKAGRVNAGLTIRDLPGRAPGGGPGDGHVLPLAAFLQSTAECAARSGGRVMKIAQIRQRRREGLNPQGTFRRPDGRQSTR
jgi:hypothetical protein